MARLLVVSPSAFRSGCIEGSKPVDQAANSKSNILFGSDFNPCLNAHVLLSGLLIFAILEVLD